MKKVYTETFQQHVDSITNLLFRKSSRCELTDDEMKLVKLYLHHERNPTWMPIVIDGVKTIYTIDEFGHVKNTHTNLIRNPTIGSNGYAHIGIRLYNNKTIRIVTCSIHRLVAEAFIPNPENKPQVNHINGIKTCNWVGNLEWVTAKENSKHAFDNGLHVGMPGVNNPVAIYSEDQIREVCRLLEEAKLTYPESKELADHIEEIKSKSLNISNLSIKKRKFAILVLIIITSILSLIGIGTWGYNLYKNIKKDREADTIIQEIDNLRMRKGSLMESGNISEANAIDESINSKSERLNSIQNESTVSIANYFIVAALFFAVILARFILRLNKYNVTSIRFGKNT